jgi:hypothetical protein
VKRQHEEPQSSTTSPPVRWNRSSRPFLRRAFPSSPTITIRPNRRPNSRQRLSIQGDRIVARVFHKAFLVLYSPINRLAVNLEIVVAPACEFAEGPSDTFAFGRQRDPGYLPSQVSEALVPSGFIRKIVGRFLTTASLL